MTAPDLLLAIDQGTSSTRAIVFDRAGKIVSSAQRPLVQHYPQDGWVEHDAEEIWTAAVAVCREAIGGIAPGRIAGAGITNQRETCLLWDRATGQPIHRAIVWQDRRGAPMCQTLADTGHGPAIRRATGLVLDSYFSATKLAWLLDNVPDARRRAERGDLAFGTIDTYLLWRLTGGRHHATDATNASRTMLFDIHNQCWSADLCSLFGVPMALLPTVCDCVADFGIIDASVLGFDLAIGGIAGDQHAALIGQGCTRPGLAKATYGTGCFVLTNDGVDAPSNRGALLTTIAYQLGGQVTYATEGSAFNAGTAVAWLRDNLGIVQTSGETESLASSLSDNGGVYFVPAFTGLGAPFWEPEARGAVVGLTRDTGRAHLARAALEAAAYQTHDLLAESGKRATALRIDGGMAANNWFAQFLADLLGSNVDRPAVTETTAWGAAILAGLQTGMFASLDQAAADWRAERTFAPRIDDAQRASLIAGWRRAVAQVRAGYA
ncbi:MAG: glycerol kinase GlpK [Proteobacteria bacterium]|nr:glycerol kinase GlpK [Pseudomonadota bacterium]MDA1059273.1 glycerol kinase GlpK [Pseudomonadota bacterium]